MVCWNRQQSTVALCMAVAFGGTTAHAQTRQFEEIFVTAQKREERLVEVPISMAVVGGDVLEEFKVTALDDIDRLAPNLYINGTPGNNAIFVRGIGSTAGNLAVEQSVALFVDGVYGGRARQFMAPFLDIERVEVLRGPRGATFGINTSAGAISIVTARPTEEFMARVNAGYEFEYDSYEVGGVVSGPLTSQLQGRLAVKYEDRGGYLKNTVTGDEEPESENILVRGTLAWQPADALSFLAKIEHSDFDTYGSMYQRYLPPESVIDDKKESAGFGQKDVDKSEATNFTLNVDYAVEAGTLTWITGYSEFNYDKWINADQGPDDVWVTNFREDFQQFSQELRFVSATGGTFDYIVGGYFHYNEIDPLVAITRVIFPTTAGPFNGEHEVIYRQDSQVFSLFGSLTWNISDHWRLSGDLRYSDDDKDAVQQRRIVSGTLPPTWNDQRLEGRRSDTELDPAIKLQWLPNSDLMVYAAYTEGFKSGGWQGNSRDMTEANWELKGESSENYELGIKAQLFDGQAFIAATVFDTEFEDLQVSQWTGTAFSVKNAAKATSRGLEVDGAWQINDQWNVQGGLAYLDAEYDDFPGAPCPFDNPGCDPTTNNLAGAQLGWAPEWSGNLSVNWRRPLFSGMKLNATLALQYRDDVWLDTAGDTGPDYNKQDSTTWVDGRLGLGPEDDRWVVALYGKNLTDEETKAHNFVFPFPADVVAGRETWVDGTERFREVGLEVIYNF